MIDRNGNALTRTQKFSFGVSRSSMIKLYVDEIIKKKDQNEPGPANYTHQQSFGSIKGGERYSVRPKNDLFVNHLERQKKLPGPGSYLDSVNLAGKH